MEEEEEEKEVKESEEKDTKEAGGEGEKKRRVVRLLPIQLCAARIDSLIKDFDGKLLCSELEAAFVDKYGTSLCPGQFGFPSVNSLIGTGLSKFFMVKGRGNRKIICPVKDGSPTGLGGLGGGGVGSGGGFFDRGVGSAGGVGGFGFAGAVGGSGSDGGGGGHVQSATRLNYGGFHSSRYMQCV